MTSQRDAGGAHVYDEGGPWWKGTQDGSSWALICIAGALAGGRHARATGATLRRQLINVPTRLARGTRRLVLHLPEHWPWAHPWLALWTRVFADLPPPISA